MSFNIKATIGADGSGFFREMEKVDRSQAALDSKIAARSFEKLDHQGKLNALKQQELALANRAFSLQATGDKSGAARATLAALEKREQRERMITEEKLRQQKIQTETIAQSERAAAKAVADAKARTAATLGGRVSAGAKEFGGSLIAGFGAPLAAGAAAFAVTDLARRTVEYGGTINDLSARLGVSTDALQEFDYAMGLNGATLADATLALQTLGRARKDALENGGDKLDAFKALGVSADDLKNKRIEDLFKQIGRSVRDAADVQLVLADAIQVMGKGSGNVLAAMRADLDAAADQAHRLRLIIGPEAIDDLDKLGDNFTTLGKRMKAAFAGPLLVVSEIVQTGMDGVAVLKELLSLPVSIPSRIAGAIAGGQSPAEAARSAFAETNAEIERITARQAARRADRTIAPRGEESLGIGGDATTESRSSRAVSDAARILNLRERIAKMDRDQLPLVERRMALEKEIAKLKAEEAELSATSAEDTAAEEKQLKIELDRRELEKELAGLDKDKASRAGSRFDSQQNTDALSKKGLFIGAGPSGVTVAPLTGQQATREFTRLVQTMERLITVNESGNGRVVAAFEKFV